MAVLASAFGSLIEVVLRLTQGVRDRFIFRLFTCFCVKPDNFFNKPYRAIVKADSTITEMATENACVLSTPLIQIFFYKIRHYFVFNFVPGSPQPDVTSLLLSALAQWGIEIATDILVVIVGALFGECRCSCKKSKSRSTVSGLGETGGVNAPIVHSGFLLPSYATADPRDVELSSVASTKYLETPTLPTVREAFVVEEGEEKVDVIVIHPETEGKDEAGSPAVVMEDHSSDVAVKERSREEKKEKPSLLRRMFEYTFPKLWMLLACSVYFPILYSWWPTSSLCTDPVDLCSCSYRLHADVCPP